MLLRACPESVAIAEGWVVRDHSVPRVQHLNTIRLRTAPSAQRLIWLAERWQAELPHRRVAIEDGTGEALAPQLAGRGWRRERVVLMAMDDAAAATPAAALDVVACEVDEARLRRLERELFAEADVGPAAHPSLPGQMSDAQSRLRAATRARRFAAGRAGALDAMATLFLDPDVDGVRVAQLESVATRAARRERGLAGAAVAAALRAAREWGAELVVVVADADDWPQVWYAGLGFATVGRQVAYLRPPR